MEEGEWARRKMIEFLPVVSHSLDHTRIHPQHYAVGIKIAGEALRLDEGLRRSGWKNKQ